MLLGLGHEDSWGGLITFVLAVPSAVCAAGCDSDPFLFPQQGIWPGA